MLLTDVVETSAAVAATSARTAKVAALAALLRRAAAAGDATVEIAVSFLSGELRQRRTGVGWAALRDMPPAADTPTLSIGQVDAAFAALAAAAGSGSAARRATGVRALFASATSAEQRFLAMLAMGELRQGALEAVMVEATAKAASVSLVAIRQALMIRGWLPPVASIALRAGEPGLAAISPHVGRPLRPMLAQPVASVADALAKLPRAALEYKLDGIRVQIHRSSEDVAVFTRTLDDITDRVPELVEMAAGLAVRDVVLDGEAIALDDRGRPRSFQETAARTSSRLDVEALRRRIPLHVFCFDVMHLDGESVLARPARDRQQLLEAVLPAELRVPRVVTGEPAAAEEFFAEALAHGHEGVVVKSLDSPYQAGRRGGGWLKVKPRHTLDLVVLAAEWGHGRRHGKLSNLHLGAADGNGGFVMLGKTFKGLTDEMLGWQTEQFLRLETRRNGHVVYVEPQLVAEIAFDGVQTSPRYPGGVALRFARVLRYRSDKSASEVDTIDTVRALRA
jgi:DNA ligase-1